MKVLITGGAGFIGSHLTDALLQRGHTVTIIDDLSTGKLENIAHVRAFPNFHFAIETIMNETVMDRLVSECDLIFHLASAVGVELIVNRPVEVIERCVLGTEIVLKIANRYKRKVLLTSTSEVYGKSTKVPFSEEDDRILGPTTKSRWSYSCSKAIDEFLALAYYKEMKLPVVIVRLFNTVGPRQTGQYGMVVPRFVQAAMHNKPLRVYGDGTQSRCFGYVGDVVQALIALASHPQAVGQIFNIGSNEEVTIMELAERVRAIIGSSSEIVKVPYSEAYEAGFEDMQRRVPDLTKIKRLIGYEPSVKLDQIIRSIWEYFQEKEKNGHPEGGRALLESVFHDYERL
ncbi:MAG: GDP-mannose 4,6-dehydratase [candidate division KSB1 bacterium]|nr:GDP-mannose 4,6-dehydratase [candidate division KSB1 bacterium]MDZ7275967.1 GDP-mannose 4,6-dehydratase [candidate division KSB1 bacterium]MDZ7285751.1 GDP-mannose 4,6-dehydratase [candidate division KSB1 bacterium]MDZ7298783.1 GDP-mannose 4,6-dehydratase [candidate division KSB1 bacterium]MDZ7307927.1 GDP-mannose 4,6-dehydratase [candidate division KSB1 bacterium]